MDHEAGPDAAKWAPRNYWSVKGLISARPRAPSPHDDMYTPGSKGRRSNESLVLPLHGLPGPRLRTDLSLGGGARSGLSRPLRFLGFCGHPAGVVDGPLDPPLELCFLDAQ